MSLDRNNAAPKPVSNDCDWQRDTISPLIPRVRYGKEKFYGHIRCVAISRRQIPAASFHARSVTVDLWRTRGVQTTYTAAKVIPGKSLGSKRFPAQRYECAWEEPALYIPRYDGLSRVIRLILPPLDVAGE